MSKQLTEVSALAGVSGRSGIRVRILAAVGLTALTTLAMGGVGVVQMSLLNERAQTVYQQGATSIVKLHQVEVAWWEYQTFSARSSMANMPPETLALDTKLAAEKLKALKKITTATDPSTLAPSADRPTSSTGTPPPGTTRASRTS